MTGRINNIKGRLIIALLTTLPILFSCNHGAVYSEVETISGNIWSRYNQVIFTAPVADTLTPSDILITLRTNSEYPYRNIFLFVTTTSPQGYSIKDTIEYYLADERGSWFGKGLGDIHDLSVPFKTNVLFPYQGEYIFRIEQGMRIDELAGVMDVGMRIVESEK